MSNEINNKYNTILQLGPHAGVTILKYIIIFFFKLIIFSFGWFRLTITQDRET